MITFIIGGVRSGKSKFAIELAKKNAGSVAFIATCIPKDKEMKERIKKHKAERHGHWLTIENRFDISNVLSEVKQKIVILDCLTLYTSYLIGIKKSYKEISQIVEQLCKTALSSPSSLIVVSNEVGEGVVPATKSGRNFRDIMGSCNQIVANFAKEVYLMKCGVPVKIKPMTYL